MDGIPIWDWSAVNEKIIAVLKEYGLNIDNFILLTPTVIITNNIFFLGTTEQLCKEIIEKMKEVK
jgi:hypothetical protein